MKKSVLLAISILIMCLILTGCKDKEKQSASNSSASCYELALAMAYTDEDRDSLVVCNFLDEEYTTMVDLLYGLVVSDDGCIIYSMNQNPTEYVVMRAKKYNDYINVTEIQTAFYEYIKERINTYNGYYPEGADVLSNAKVFSEGEYVVLCVSKDTTAAKEAFDKLYSSKPSEIKSMLEEYAGYEMVLEQNRREMMNSDNIITNTESDDRSCEYYNPDIVTAYIENNPELLDEEKDKVIFERVTEIINECITDDMTVLEKEKAIHDYICTHMDYDRYVLNAVSSPLENSDNPYGMLVDGYGTCTGYASTFKLFMDCLGIECIIVYGYAFDYDTDHAWNKVKIGVTWYNVDITWDDQTKDEIAPDNTEQTPWTPCYTYFNCSDEKLLEDDHIWDQE